MLREDFPTLRLTRCLLRGSPYANTWFPIETPVTTDRYIHLGKISHGCVTIGINEYKLDNPNYNPNDPSTIQTYANWTDVYDYLIRSRLDDEYIGTVEVIQ